MLEPWKYSEHTHDDSSKDFLFRPHIFLYHARFLFPLLYCWKTTPCVTILFGKNFLSNIKLFMLSTIVKLYQPIQNIMCKLFLVFFAKGSLIIWLLNSMSLLKMTLWSYHFWSFPPSWSMSSY